MNRRQFLTALGGAAAASAVRLSPTSAAEAVRPLNVVLLMSDEHNPAFTSVQGHPMVQTPNLERMAARGTVFVNGYCPSPLCVPSRSSFVSGLRTHRTRMYSNCNAIPFDYPSYGQVLAEQDVYTVHMGKMDVYRPTKELGFSETHLAWDRAKPGDINFRRRPLTIRTDGAVRAHEYGPREEPFKHDDAIMARAIEWLDMRPAGLDRPWTLAINIEKPHFPHHVTQELWDLYPDGGDLPAFGREAESARHPYAQDLRAHFQTEGFTEEQVRGLRRGYLGCVTYVDRQVGRVMEAIERNGLAENTVFVYTSDHGEMLGKFGLWWKCSLYEDSVRVPVFAMGPGFEAGRRVTTPVDLLDVQATLFAATGAKRPANWVGQPLQTIAPQDGSRVVFAEYHGHGTRAGGYVIRKGDWKLIYCIEAPHLLFNLAEDPQELRNRVSDAPEKFRELEGELRAVCDPEEENRRAFAFEDELTAAIGAREAAASGA